jgi:large subunit ribosomal protein L18
MARPTSRQLARKKRHQRLRVRLQGTVERPRLNVFRSLRHVYVQLIDDAAGHTMLSVSTLDPEVSEKLGDLNKTDQAKLVGAVLAERALRKGVKQVVFDRGGYKYHGRVKALAEAARAGGLEF